MKNSRGHYEGDEYRHGPVKRDYRDRFFFSYFTTSSSVIIAARISRRKKRSVNSVISMVELNALFWRGNRNG
jgi:hypothetical protein